MQRGAAERRVVAEGGDRPSGFELTEMFLAKLKKKSLQSNKHLFRDKRDWLESERGCGGKSTEGLAEGLGLRLLGIG